MRALYKETKRKLKKAYAKKRKLKKAYAKKRIAAGAHLPTPWRFEPVKHPDDRTNYCLDTLHTLHFFTQYKS